MDRTLLRRFHAEVNDDETADVPEWEGEGHTRTRTLTFRTPFNAPAAISRMVGADAITVVETQTFCACPEDGSIRVESTPMPQIPGAANFASSAALTFRDAPGGGGCALVATVACTAAGPYGLVGTIEKFMATAAQQSLLQFLSYCADYIASIQAAQGGLEAALAAVAVASSGGAAIAAISAPPAPARALPEDETPAEVEYEGAEFYDVEDEGSVGSVSLEAVLLNMQHLARTGDHVAAALRSIDARLAVLETTVLESARENSRRIPPVSSSVWGGWIPEMVSTRDVAWSAGLVVGTAALTVVLLSWRGRPLPPPG